jgi:hypothetical protein
MLFQIIYLLLAFAWAFMFALLIVGGAIIGFVIGLVLLFLIVGWLNVVLADLIWNIQIESNWKILLAHGFVLFLLLLLASIPSIALNIVAPSLATTVIVFIIYSFINGFIAKSVAKYWEEKGEETSEI